MHKVDRPREKLQKAGAAALRDEELFAVLLGTGTNGKGVLSVARDLTKKLKGKKISDISLRQLQKQKGIGLAKACVLHAAFELASRFLQNDAHAVPAVETPRDVLAQVQEIRARKRENFVVLYLNARNQLAHKEFVSIGSLNSTVVHPREVFLPAVQHSSASVILTHNHPSGDCQPSREDIELTKRLVAAGELLGIEVLDHIIVSPQSYLSIREKGLCSF